MPPQALPPYLFAYAETLRAEPAVAALEALAGEQGVRLWVTGGTLRDALLTRWPRDLDLAVAGDVDALGKALARKVKAKFVPLDPATGVARVAIRSSQGIDWIDLVALRAPGIEDDLRARDFTVNAVAIALDGLLGRADAAYIDPTGGRDDLHAHVIRMTSEKALADDPLRILRAYRFAAQLGFEIEPETAAALTRLAPKAAEPAPERVHHELSRLLRAPAPADVLERMMADGVLGAILPELAATVGVTQNDHHHLPVWEHTVETVRRMGEILSDPPEALAADAAAVRDDPALREVLAWGALCHDIGKPACRGEADGKVHFRGHEDAGADLFLAAAKRLRLQGWKARRVAGLVRHHLRPLHLTGPFREGALTIRAVDRLHQALGDDLGALFLLAVADSRASLGPARPADAEAVLLGLYRHILAVREERIRPLEAAPRLLTGRDLTDRLGVPKGPRVGELLEALREAQLAGEVTDRAGAEAWVRDRRGEG
jgi:poly(A) polymerase